MILDGGLATTLQRAGLPPFSPVEPWVGQHPDRIAAAHRAFVEAGATDVLTATFLCAGLPADALAVRDRAVELARDARPDRVWLALGPVGDPSTVAPGAPVDGLVLETRTDPVSAEADVTRVRAVWTGLLAVTLVPGPDGDVPGGVSRAATRLRAAGADIVGFNCAPVEAVLRALDRLPPGIPGWAKPNGTADVEAFARALASAGTHVRWRGGCCGAGPEHIRALAVAARG